jgi:uncharacterized membrane protein YczE
MSATQKFFLPVTGPYLPQRLTRLMVGLLIFGIGTGLMIQSDLGLSPWDVLHQGLSINFGLTVGRWTIIVSFLVLLLWVPIREKYGLGTLANAIVIGLSVDATVAMVAIPDGMIPRSLFMIVGILFVGFASGLYIGASLGPGPRDGLMTGLAKRGPSIRLTRFGIEAVVLAAGWLLGGTVGLGTVLFAVFIGPLVQLFLNHLSFERIKAVKA